MTPWKRLGTVALVSLAAATSVYAEKRAFLVGVSQYPGLPKEAWLKGPENDVVLIRSLLTTPACGFKTNCIAALSGWPEKEALRPTRANVLAEIRKLTDTTSKGDFVFLLFSGHGSQQPASPGQGNIETDGLDEIFLPADAGKWDDRSKSVANAITDNEVGERVQRILARGASVWIVFDSCHSGTMTRDFAGGDRQYRRIAPEDLIPQAALQEAGRHAARTRSVHSADSPHDLAADRPGLIAMYAAQSFEPTFELPLPAPDSSRHGIFTYTIAKVLQSAQTAMTYRELTDRIITLYRCNGIQQPTPVLEGSALDALVMDSRDLAARPSVRMFRNPLNERVIIDQGSLHGIGTRSLFEVFPPAGLAAADAPIGYVEVSRVSALASEVEPVAYAGKLPPPAGQLGLGNRCRMARLALDLPPLRVAVQQRSDAAPRAPPGEAPKEALAAHVQAIAGQSPNLIEVVPAERADWVLSHEGARITLRTLAQAAQATNRLLVADLSLPRFRSADAIRQATRSALLRVARARQLLHLCSPAAEARTSLDLGIDLVRYASETARNGAVVKPERTGRVLRHGDIVSFRITNPNRFPIDVSLLFVDSQYGIMCLFPERGTVDSNRVLPSQTIETPRIAVSATTTGPEQVVAIAVRSTLDRQDFSCLEQESLEQMRDVGGLSSPLGRLLETTIYGRGDTRGLDRGALSTYRVTSLPWITAP